MQLHPRCLVPLCALMLAATPACDSDKKEDPNAGAAKKADAKKADTKADKKVAAKPKTLAPGKVEHPWSWERISGAIKGGQSYSYKLTGSDEKGKALTPDDFLCKIAKANKKEVGVSCNTVTTPSKDKGAGLVATMAWSEYSPMFSVEKPTTEYTRREQLTVPAGEFDCVVAELKDFFGKQLTVWMIVDKPGVYAKIVETYPNAEDNKTNRVYELATIVAD